MRIENAVRRHAGVARRSVRGGALVSALFVTFILTMLTASTAVLVTSSYSRSWSDAKSETALQLAEAGADEELRYITARMQQYNSPFSHGPATLNGEPYPGNPGTVAGVAGKYWVFATKPGSNQAWDGQGPVQITCNALAWGEPADPQNGQVPQGA